MPGYRIISSDNHIFEPADLWTTRAEPQFRDRAPRIVREADGDWWYCDNHRVIGMGAGAQTGMRFGQSDQLRRTTTFEHVRPGGYIPAEHVKDMDTDGVEVSIVYPTVGLLLYSVPDGDLLTEIFRTTTTGWPSSAPPPQTGSRASPRSTSTTCRQRCRSWSAAPNWGL